MRSLLIVVAVLFVSPAKADDTDVAVALALAKAKVLALSKQEETPPPPVKTDPDDGTVWSYEDGSSRAKESGKPLVTWIGYDDPSAAGSGFVTCSARQLVGFPDKCVIVSVWVKGRHAGVVTTEADAGSPKRIQEIASQIPR